jgi:hypothetical protein
MGSALMFAVNGVHPARPYKSPRPAAVVVLALLVIVCAVVAAASIVQYLGLPEDDELRLTGRDVWPPFTMIYTLRVVEPNGQLIRDQTYQLDVTDENHWRDILLRDGLRPAANGSTRDYQNGRGCSFDAERNERLCSELVNRTPHWPITFALDAWHLPLVRMGYRYTWRLGRASRPGRIAAVSEHGFPCVPPADGTSPTTCFEQERVEWDAATVGPLSLGGVPVFAERRVNGEVVLTFHAQSWHLTRR